MSSTTGAHLLGSGSLLDNLLGCGLLSSRLLGSGGLLDGSRLLGRSGELNLSAGSLGEGEDLLLGTLSNGLGDVVVERGFRDLAGDRVLLLNELLDRRSRQTGAGLLRVGKDGFLDHGLEWWRRSGQVGQ